MKDNHYPNYMKCPMVTAQELISGKWKILILWHLSQRTMRFGELMRQLVGINQTTLTKQLRNLEENQLINRKVFLEVPPHVEYSLTPLGKAFCTVIDSIAQWGEYYIQEVGQQQGQN